MAGGPPADLTIDTPGAATLLHGFTGSAAGWQRARQGLSRLGVTSHAVDLPGHGARAGEADPQVFSLDATLDAIDRAMVGQGATSLVGYSMGGRLALHFAMARPGRVRRLVLESASPGIADDRERADRVESDDVLASAIEQEGVAAFVDRWEALPIFETQRQLPDEVRVDLRRRRLANDARSLAASLRGVGTGVLPSLWDRLGEVVIPVLLIVGALDEKFVSIADRMAARLPRAEVIVVEGAGHRVHLERPEAWSRAVASFLSGDS